MKTKLIMLPTDNWSDIVLSTSQYGGLFKSEHYSPMKEMGDSYQHIYLVSDDEIKEGDWFINTTVNKVFDCNKDNNCLVLDQPHLKKIVASTDKSLNLPYLDLNKDKWIIDYYNKNGKLPDEIELEVDENSKLVLCNGVDNVLTTNYLKSFSSQPTEKLYTRDEVIAYTDWLRNDRIAFLMLRCKVMMEETEKAPTPEDILEAYENK